MFDQRFVVHHNNQVFIKWKFLFELFPLEGDEKRRRRKLNIYEWFESFLHGSTTKLEDGNFPYGIKQKGREHVISEQLLKMLIVMAPGSILPWTTARRSFINNLYPGLAIPSDNSPESCSPQLRRPQANRENNFPRANSQCDNPQSSNTISTTNIFLNRHVKSTFENIPVSLYWNAMFKFLCNPNHPERLIQFSASLDAFLKKSKTHKRSMDTDFIKSIIPIIFPHLFDKNNIEDIEIELVRSLILKNPRELLACIRRIIVIPSAPRFTILPNRFNVQNRTTLIRQDFLRIMKPSRTILGFRVDLRDAVKFVALFVNGQDTLKGLRVDIYGDGMQMGKRDVTRVAFRILQDGHIAQSSSHVFTFASFQGKDTDMNLKLNLGTNKNSVAGEKGWLYEETRKLVQEDGVILSCSGDCPFIYRLLTGTSTDKGCLSGLRLYVKMPPDNEIEDVESSLRKKHGASYKVFVS